MGKKKKFNIAHSDIMEEFPPGYVFDLNARRIERHFPNLKLGENAFLKSKKGDDYNCAAWAVEIKEDWIEFRDGVGNLDMSPETYVAYYEKFGFIVTDNSRSEKGITKIVIYTDDKGEFTHVARQLTNGYWTSKIGDWEDIEHTTLEALGGRSYGNPKIIMKREENLQIG